MNQDQQSPEDHPRRAADQADSLRRLSEIERRLGAHRPRPVHFDVEAIVGAARAADEEVALSERQAGQGGARRAGIGAIAASWLCGAVAGAVVTAVLLHRAAPSGASSDPALARQSEPVDRAGQGNPPRPDPDSGRQARPRGPAPRDPGRTLAGPPAESLVVSLLLDSYRGDSAVLRAGALASGRLAAESLRLDYGAGSVLDEPIAQPPQNGDAAAEFRDERPMTRQQLLQELLQERSNSLL